MCGLMQVDACFKGLRFQRSGTRFAISGCDLDQTFFFRRFFLQIRRFLRRFFLRFFRGPKIRRFFLRFFRGPKNSRPLKGFFAPQAKKI